MEGVLEQILNELKEIRKEFEELKEIRKAFEEFSRALKVYNEIRIKGSNDISTMASLTANLIKFAEQLEE